VIYTVRFLVMLLILIMFALAMAAFEGAFAQTFPDHTPIAGEYLGHPPMEQPTAGYTTGKHYVEYQRWEAWLYVVYILVLFGALVVAMLYFIHGRG
jgi:hypothetical protein